jgi:CheY-like chemotaxis protein
MPDGGDLYLESTNEILDEKAVASFDGKPGKYVKISVTDTGEGMDEQTQRRVFEPFFTTKKMGLGTGLGLASAYGIVTNHGGMITVTSKKGEGTAFSLYFPASQKRVRRDHKTSEIIVGGDETVLLVDDENMILKIGKRILTSLGYTVLTAQGGREAVKLYQQKNNAIDIVVLDMIMPDQGGGEAYDHIKNTNPNAKVLLSSGYSLDGQASTILQRGCNGFIQKPFNIKQLSQKLREVLDAD